ncbi:copper homeostasis protein CutC [Paraflavitalea pollutisoli]|uniref:copper homeostasis protein CutC n=1 Tax=Paraflavitalea pollutisoli TaxID=3034143 RepID=UPI0023ED979E|nr:copper homeostasis protein CutC [Paraflavitalea sp. H1-2-19X]
MADNIVLEVCAFNIQSSLVAARVGATRVELCDNPGEGGTTPSHGAILRVREQIGLELYPIIRPRGGNFLYDDDEWAIIKKDILLCKELGCDGISTGVHLQNGEIDIDRMKQIMSWAYPMGVTCHRVFDRTPDPYQALEQLIELGCERVLTSGQASGAPEGIDVLAKLVTQANGRIIIMPGAGVRAANIATLIKGTGAVEYHTSARVTVPDTVSYRQSANFDFGGFPLANEEELSLLLSNAQQAMNDI